MPPALANKPKRHAWMEMYLKAFDVLSRKRLHLYSPQSIQYSEMGVYADRNNIEDFELFESILAKLDDIFVTRYNEKAAAERTKPTRSGVKKRGGK